MIETRPCLAIDIEALLLNSVEPTCVAGDPRAMLTQNAISFLVDGTLAACGGITPMWPGVGHAWLIINTNMEGRHTRSLMRVIIGELTRSLETYHRIHCVVQCDFSKGRRLVRWLGFRREGRLKKITSDGKDGIMYAIVKEGG